MQLWTAYLPLLALISCAVGDKVCLTNEPDASTQRRISSLRQATSINNQTVDVYFHVASTTSNQHTISDAVIEKQFDVLQDAFVKYSFHLNLVNTSKIVDDVIGKGFYNDELNIDDFDGYLAYLRASRKGGYDALNIYFFSNLTPALGGSCNLPTLVDEGDDFFYRDGCIVNGDTMPGLVPRNNSTAPPNRGHTAIHEAGHWFGLLHTFHGRSCDRFNDNVDDTPAQAGSSSGCQRGRDSCPDLPGLDPIENYMDYSDDSCTTEFTPGQKVRMHEQFTAFRRPAPWTDE